MVRIEDEQAVAAEALIPKEIESRDAQRSNREFVVIDRRLRATERAVKPL
jgi:hypothetical protein